MTRLTFIADGNTCDFYFTFPFFLKSDVVVEINSTPATKYNLICVSDGLNTDIPFSGGRVHFSKPPKQGDVIKIYRHLPTRRIVDYQPTAPYNPMALNHDLNYLMEMIKDTKDMIEERAGLSSGGIDTETLNTIFGKIEQVIEITNTLNQRIDNLDQPSQPEDLSELYATMDNVVNAIQDLNTTIAAHTSNISALQTSCGQLAQQIENAPAPSLPDNIDYVVEWQNPTEENGYTWYRKYASGWVEQGGAYTGALQGTVSVNLLIAFNDTNYSVTITQGVFATKGSDIRERYIQSKTKNSFVTSSISSIHFTWYACGVME